MAADPRFFPCSGPHSLEKVLAAAEGTAEGGAAERFTGVAALGEAGPGEITFCDGARHAEALRATRAAAVIVAAAQQLLVPAAAIAIVVRNPALAFARVASLFHPPPPPQPGVHPTAVLGEGVVLGDGVEIGPYAVIGARARIGAGSIIGPHAVVGEAVELGEGCRLHAHASISHAICGPRVVLHPGARIGQEGFGFVPTPDGRFVTVPQLGLVRLGEGVEIGANSCVDRGSQSDTVLGPGTRLDNLVQVGHNVRTGRGCVLVAQVGISGSTRLGDYVTLAGQAGATGHITIGDGARVGAQAGVMRDVAAGEDVVGSPAMPARDWMRQVMVLKRLAERSRGGKGGSE